MEPPASIAATCVWEGPDSCNSTMELFSKLGAELLGVGCNRLDAPVSPEPLVMVGEAAHWSSTLILHDWTDEDCVKILKMCKKAIPSKEDGGKVIIVDIVVNTGNDDPAMLETKLFWDMVMMMSTEGKEREEHEWKKIFVDAGYSDYKITPLGMRSLIEVFP